MAEMSKKMIRFMEVLHLVVISLEVNSETLTAEKILVYKDNIIGGTK
jgi:hypothetical protein